MKNWFISLIEVTLILICVKQHSVGAKKLGFERDDFYSSYSYLSMWQYATSNLKGLL